MAFDVGVTAFILFGLLLSGVVKGSTGIGYASCALPFLVYTVDLKDAITIALVPAVATNVTLALTNGYLIETCRAFKNLFLAIIVGIVVGIWLLAWIDAKIAVKCLAVSIIAYAAFTLWRPNLRLPPGLVDPLQIPVGLVHGVLTGLTGSQVMPLIPYFLATGLEPRQTIQGINLAVLGGSTIVIGGLASAGMASTATLLLAVLAIIPALIGVEIGRRLQSRLPTNVFRISILVVLLFSGIGMLAR